MLTQIFFWLLLFFFNTTTLTDANRDTEVNNINIDREQSERTNALHSAASPPIAMLAYLLHAPAAAVPSPLSIRAPPTKTPFLPSAIRPSAPPRRATAAGAFSAAAVGPIAASLLEGPVLLWAGRLCVYYALIQIGLAGSPRNPFLSHGNNAQRE